MLAELCCNLYYFCANFVYSIVLRKFIQKALLSFSYLPHRLFFFFYSPFQEAATRGVLCKKVFLKILQHSQENTCARASLLIKLQAAPVTLFKKGCGTGVFL